MNKRIKFDKGITLIALIITIIVLLILAGTTVFMLIRENGILKRAENAKVVNEYETLREEIALKIMDISTQVIQEEGRTIRIGDLRKLNIDKFSVGDTSTFPVTVTTEKYEYEINDKFEVSYVGEASGLRITYSLSTTDYTNEDVIITIKVTADGTIQNIEAPEELTKNEDETYTVSQNGTYIFKVSDTTGNEVTKEIIISNIDKTEPEDFIPIISEVKISGFKIIANAVDNDSGIAAYEYHVGDKIYSSIQGEYVVNDLEIGTEYDVYVIVTDKAGNKKECQNQKITTDTLVRGANLWNLGIENSDFETYQGTPEYKGEEEGVYLNNSIISTKTNYVLPTNYTIILEIKNVTRNGYGFMLTMGAAGSGIGGRIIGFAYPPNGKIEAYSGSGDGYTVIGNTSLCVEDSWNRLAIKYNGTTFSYFINDTKVGFSSKSSLKTSKLYIGGTSNSGTTGSGYYWGYGNGYYRNLVIYDEALSDEEIIDYSF